MGLKAIPSSRCKCGVDIEGIVTSLCVRSLLWTIYGHANDNFKIDASLCGSFPQVFFSEWEALLANWKERHLTCQIIAGSLA